MILALTLFYNDDADNDSNGHRGETLSDGVWRQIWEGKYAVAFALLTPVNFLFIVDSTSGLSAEVILDGVLYMDLVLMFYI